MDTIEEIKRLKALLDEGAINETEFNHLKIKIIDNGSLNETVDSKSIDFSEGKNNRHSSLYKRILLNSFYILIFASAVLGIKYFITSIQKVSNEKRIQITDNIDGINKKGKNGNVVYQDGKEVGRIVKMDINALYRSDGTGGVTKLNIPQGMMWTPLYYEITKGTESLPRVWIYSVKRRNGWAKSDSYKFEESKHFFISIKYSKQNFKPLTAKTQPAIIVNSDSRAICTIYFFEESVN